MSGPFRATQRWNGIIKHLRENVDVKPHKSKTKRFEGCFAGADAVNVLLPYLQQSGFERDISRENAVKLCQLLLEQTIFEDVLALSQLPLNTKPTFQDNSAHFYRFVGGNKKELRNSQRLSDTARHQAVKRSTEDEDQCCPHFDRKKKLRNSFGAGKSKNEYRFDENEGAAGLSNLFDRKKKKKRSSFGLGKFKVDVLSRVEEGNRSDTPTEKKKRKRNSLGFGRLKAENSYNISGSFESIPQSGDKRRASFRLYKHKLDSKCDDVGSQESLSHPERKKGRRSFGSFRLGKRTETKNKDFETGSETSEMSQQSENHSTSSNSTSQSYVCYSRSVQSLTSEDIDVNEIWKESTIQRLLELVDIPMLEDILSCTENFAVPSYSSGGTATSGNGYKQEVTSDPWLSAALACLQSHPDSDTIAASFLSATNNQSQPSIHARKLLLFQTLTNHRAQQPRKGSLIPAELREVLTAILGSIARGKTSIAIELAQLVMVMLGEEEREELQRLLRFMATASSQTAVKLSYEMDNRVTVIVSFTPAIIASEIVSPVQAKNLVAFMMDCVEWICKVPQFVAKKAEKRISRLKAGLRDDSLDSHCIRVTPQQYQQQRTAGTHAALRDLTNAIIDNVKIPLKDKKQHLQDLKKHHPKVASGCKKFSAKLIVQSAKKKK